MMLRTKWFSLILFNVKMLVELYAIDKINIDIPVRSILQDKKGKKRKKKTKIRIHHYRIETNGRLKQIRLMRIHTTSIVFSGRTFFWINEFFWWHRATITTTCTCGTLLLWKFYGVIWNRYRRKVLIITQLKK